MKVLLDKLLNRSWSDVLGEADDDPPWGDGRSPRRAQQHDLDVPTGQLVQGSRQPARDHVVELADVLDRILPGRPFETRRAQRRDQSIHAVAPSDDAFVA